MLARIRRKKNLLSDRAARVLGIVETVTDIVDDFVPLPSGYYQCLALARKLGLATEVKRRDDVESFLREQGYK